MKRREFITLLGGGAAVWPLAARAQEPVRIRRIGILTPNAEGDLDVQVRLKAFVEGLQKLGWTNGHNVQIDVRFAGGNDDRFRT